MLNNSSLQKWSRLKKKSLDNMFMNEIIAGMNCSPFEAKAALDTVHKVYGDFFESSKILAPGKANFIVLSAEVSPSVMLKNALKGRKQEIMPQSLSKAYIHIIFSTKKLNTMSAMYGIRLSPFQGSYFCYPMYIGRCPVLLLMPFQGKFVIKFLKFINACWVEILVSFV